MSSFKAFDKVSFSGKTEKPGVPVSLELTDAGYSNCFIPINNGFVRPLTRLVGGRYPRHPHDEGGVTYGFGFHCHSDCYSCFTPVDASAFTGAFFEIEFFLPEKIESLTLRTRAGGDDDEAYPKGGGLWDSSIFKKLEGGKTHKLRVRLPAFDAVLSFKLDCAAEDIIYVKEARVIPVMEALSDGNGDWIISFPAPLPYGFKEKIYSVLIRENDKTRSTESFHVQRDLPEFPREPLSASISWILNRFADRRLNSMRGAFPLFYYDPYASHFYGGSTTMWIRPYPVMSLAELAMKRTLDPEYLKAVADYVENNYFLDDFYPEKRRAYMEYCGVGNYYYGAASMLYHACGDERLKKSLLCFVGKYMHSQKVHTEMKSYPAVCHRYRGDQMPTITVCGHEETMHAAIVEAYRLSGDPELLHEACGERGAGFLEHPVHGAVFVPERLRSQPDASALYGYYISMHAPWARSRDAIHYRAEGLIRLYEVTGDERWIKLAARRSSNYMRYIGEQAGNEFLDINFEYPQGLASQYQTEASVQAATGGTDGEYFQDIYTGAHILEHYPCDFYLREKLRKSVMLAASVTRMNTDDPESFGEAWIPHYAWDGDYAHKSAGSRIMSPAIHAGLMLKAEAVGFRFSDSVSYSGPLYGTRKLLDASEVPENARLAKLEGFFDLPDGEALDSLLEIRNLSSEPIFIKNFVLNSEQLSASLAVKSSCRLDISGKGLKGRKNSYVIEFESESPCRMMLFHIFRSDASSLFGTAMDEYYGGRFVRRNLILNNPYSPVAEKSFHDPLDASSYFRQLPADEGYETLSESSYLKTWKPFMELASKSLVKRELAVDASSRLSVSGEKLMICNELWKDENGHVINDASNSIFLNPSSVKIIEVRRNGELDPLHPESSIPAHVYIKDGELHADILNWTGASELTIKIHTDEKLVLGIPLRSSDTGVRFNGELVYSGHELRLPNGFRIDAASEDASYIYLRMKRKGSIKVKISSSASLPGAPDALTAVRVDCTQISSSAVRLRWASNLEESCGHYNVYRADSADAEPYFISWSPEAFYTDFSALKNKKYFYYVSAVSKDGIEGVLSAAASL